jgi:flagellar hook-associated protein FlgK
VSTFGALNTASTALWAQQRGLDVTGQNVANVNTDGYSRQRAELRSMGGTAVPAIYSVSRQVGAGVNAENVARIRDAFLEGRAQVEHASTAQLTAESDALSQVEQAFREPGKTGIQSMLTDMWSGWSDVVNHPEDLAARSQLLQRTQTLVDGFNTTSATLDKQEEQTRDNLATLVADVNASVRSIASLNLSIKQATQAGLPANELADKRDALVLTLSGQIGATSSPAGDGAVSLMVGGTTLVNGGSPLQLVVGPVPPATGDPVVMTATGGSTLAVGGTAAGQLTALRTTIPQHRKELDARAAQLAAVLNAAQQGPAAGQPAYDLNGDPGAALLGTSDGSAVVTAGNLRLAVTDPAKVAAALLPKDANGVPSRDGGNADAVYQLRLGADSVDAQYRSLVVGLGVKSAVATRNLDIQGVISAQVDSSRESVSGVSLDEEMTNMLAYQHAYSAAARMITAVDETLDTLINKTGLVGR